MSAESMVREHRSQLVQLRSMADADIRSLLAIAGRMPVAAVRDLLIEALPEIVSPYLTASGELAAVLFEDLRLEAGRRGVFYADVVASLPAASRVESVSRWAVAPLADDALASTVTSRVSGSVARMIMDASRDTIEANGARESTQFQRMARPGACAFCGLLASRPPYMAYRSAVSAGEVVGRGSTRTGFDADGKRLSGGVGGGIKVRGAREIGNQYHDDCRCVVVPLYRGSEMAELARVEREAWEVKYQQSLTDEDGKQLYEMKDILSEWRKYHGTR